MPNSVGWQTFYGTIPAMLLLASIYFNQRLLLKDVLDRLRRVEVGLTEVRDALSKVRERLIALEARAGIIYKE